jgi:AcrR family transcriptional regulator
VPRLWNETIEAHRQSVRDATLDAAATLVAEHGLTSVTMSKIAERTGIGRATLYKYFPDVDAILSAWHERQIAGHLAELADIRDQTAHADERLEAVLRAYALIQHRRVQNHRHEDRGSELAALLHSAEPVARAQQPLHDLFRDLLADGVLAGDIRDDLAPDELATYCLHALTAAGDLVSEDAVHRLVTVTLTGLRGSC